MFTRKNVRRAVFLALVLFSAALLIWGFWPVATQLETLPLRPQDLQIPTPTSWLAGWL